MTMNVHYVEQLPMKYVLRIWDQFKNELNEILKNIIL